MTTTDTFRPNTYVPPIAMEMNGRQFVPDAKGNMLALDTIKPVDLLMDETVRKIAAFAKDLSAQIARFKQHTFADIYAFQSLIDQEYGASVGGAKGNITLRTLDGALSVQVQISDRIEFGPELQTAKKLIDECLLEWAAESRSEIQALVNRVFNVDKEGQINQAALFMLLRVDITDERWQRAMEAIRDSIRIVGSKAYVRCYERPEPEAAEVAIPLNIAAV